MRYLPGYINDMISLKEKQPKTYQYLQDGGFVVRRSSRRFHAVASDQALEQTINHEGKSKGGVIIFTMGIYISKPSEQIVLWKKGKLEKYAGPLFTDLNLLKFEDIYRLSTTKFVLSFIRKDLPTPLGNMYTKMNDVQIHNTRTNLAYKIKPKSRRTLQASHSILHQGPLLWNNIPQHI